MKTISSKLKAFLAVLYPVIVLAAYIWGGIAVISLLHHMFGYPHETLTQNIIWFFHEFRVFIFWLIGTKMVKAIIVR